MKVLAATRETQGWRDNDFCCTLEGELVLFPPFECGRGSIDDECGCRRSMAGVVSHLATTTIKVVEREELNPDLYFTLISDGLRDMGWVTKELLNVPDVDGWLHHLTAELMCIADAFRLGAVLERRGGMLSRR